MFFVVLLAALVVIHAELFKYRTAVFLMSAWKSASNKTLVLKQLGISAITAALSLVFLFLIGQFLGLIADRLVSGVFTSFFLFCLSDWSVDKSVLKQIVY